MDEWPTGPNKRSCRKIGIGSISPRWTVCGKWLVWWPIKTNGCAVNEYLVVICACDDPPANIVICEAVILVVACEAFEAPSGCGINRCDEVSWTPLTVGVHVVAGSVMSAVSTAFNAAATGNGKSGADASSAGSLPPPPHAATNSPADIMATILIREHFFIFFPLVG